MVPSQACKVVQAIAPGVIKDNGDFTATEIDTLGFDYCTIIVQLGATDIAMAALKVQEDDATGMSSAADVTGLIVGTSKNDAGNTSALPSATDDNKFMAFDIDLRYRKRFLKVSAKAGNGTSGTYLSALALLSRADTTPTTAAQRGFDEVLRV